MFAFNYGIFQRNYAYNCTSFFGLDYNIQHQMKQEFPDQSSIEQNQESKVQPRKLRVHSQSVPLQEDYEDQQELDVVDQEQLYASKNKKSKKKQSVVRKPGRSKSEVQTSSMPLGPKSKRKYDKKENQGNILVEEARTTSILRQLCTPDGFITVDSLGHALQKLHIEFNLRDVSDMLSLYWRLKQEQIPENEQDRIAEDQDGDINLSLKLNPNQFKQLYKTIRRKK